MGAPIPAETHNDITQLQNSFGEAANDLAEFWALFDWSDPDGDTEIITSLTLLSLVMHLVIPLWQMMLIGGAAVFLRYTPVYTMIHTFGKGANSWRRTSWSRKLPNR